MTANVLFVSVNRSFDPRFTLSQLEPWVDRAWAMTVAKAASCDRVVAVAFNSPVACWRIRNAFPSKHTYQTTGGERPRVELSLGEPLPVLPEFREIPSLRHGAAVVALDIDALEPERDESILDR